jgi:hypothetical protein
MMQIYDSASKYEINLVILFRKILNKGKKEDHSWKVVFFFALIY